jgi:hypothetical protein
MSLQNAGFTDIKMMPSSFIIRAKDKDGNPVMMVINPDSITEVTTTGLGAGSTGKSSGPSSGIPGESRK